jgi:hypothetical protein
MRAVFGLGFDAIAPYGVRRECDRSIYELSILG